MCGRNRNKRQKAIRPGPEKVKSQQRNRNMKTGKQFELILLIAIATATTPVLADNGLESAHVAEQANAIRPFQVHVPDEALTDLRRRITATRWPEKETVSDNSQGVPLATMQELARYWATGEFLHRRKGNALRVITDRFLFGPARCSDAPAEIRQRFVRNMDLEGADCVGLFSDMRAF